MMYHDKVVVHYKPERLLELLHHGIVNLKLHTHDRRSPSSSHASVGHSRRNINVVKFNAQCVAVSPLHRLILLRNNHLKVYGDLAAHHTGHYFKDSCHRNHRRNISYATSSHGSPLHHVCFPRPPAPMNPLHLLHRQHGPSAPSPPLRIATTKQTTTTVTTTSRDGSQEVTPSIRAQR
jgi:hypothetical protein